MSSISTSPRRPQFARRNRVPGGALRGLAAAIAVAGLATQAGLTGAQAALASGPPMIPVPHHHTMIPVNSSVNALGFESTNWSGYALTGVTGSFTSAAACWTVPAVSPSSGDTYSSTWVGVDGDGLVGGVQNTNLIQTGTEEDYRSGVATYSAWWEILPATATTISGLTVKPGDNICSSVAKGTGGNWNISLTDATTPSASNPFTTSQPYSGAGASAEWIQERPYVGPSGGPYALATLANYSQVAFTQATANGASPQLTPADALAMLNCTGPGDCTTSTPVISAPSNPAASLDGFDVAYGSSPPGVKSSTPPEGEPFESASAEQYSLSGSDGSTWQPVDVNSLSSTFTPSAASTAVVVGNADMWTSTAGYNQDLGIEVTTSTGSPSIVAWKESGGFAGTFSPNAAAVQAEFPVSASTSYIVTLVWKSNRPMPAGDSIFIAAGQPGAFSPTTLTTTLYPTTGSPLQAVSATHQYTLSGSDGATWETVDATNLSTTLTPSASSDVDLTANADLWTSTAGYNQDIGICVVPGAVTTSTCPTGDLMAWKESGGFAGTFSPNAAFVQAQVPMSSGTTYTVTLAWKSNIPMPAGDSIWIAAGQTGAFSPTTLFADSYSSSAAPTEAISTYQYYLTGSDGVDWAFVDQTKLEPTITSSATCEARITANADLWTAGVGYNQDLGIALNQSGAGWLLQAWKESGGFAGTFSPNAAYAGIVVTLTPGTSSTVALILKSNIPDSGSVFIGAGPIAGAFSPTTLIVSVTC